MLRTIQLTRTNNQAWRLVGIAIFTLLTIASAKMSIEIGSVPFTMQVLVVLLSGMILGSRDGAASQIGYIALIATGLPLDARGLGTAAFFGPTGAICSALLLLLLSLDGLLKMVQKESGNVG